MGKDGIDGFNIQYMISSFYEDSRLRASPRHGGAGSVFAFCLIFN